MSTPHVSDGAAAPAPTTVWETVRASIRGDRIDLTSAPLGRAVILLAIPMVLEMVMESVFAVVDIFFVSRLGEDAVASVALTESLMALVYTLGIGLGIGATAMVARRIGEKDAEAASHTAAQALLLGLLVAAAIGLVGFFQAERLLELMGGEPATVATGRNYTRVMLTGNATVLLVFLLNAVFRGAGDAAIAMRVLWLANLINIVLDPCLIFGLGPFPELGVTGAAVATNIGRGTAVLFQVWILLSGRGRIHVLPRHLALAPGLMARVLRLSGTGTFQVFVGTASWIGLIRILAEFGPEALAGYAIGIRIILLAILPSWGLSNAASTLVGQALGAGDPERAERAVWIACRVNLVFLGGLGAIFLVFAGPIAALFGGEAVTLGYARDTLRIVSAGFFFYAYGMVLTASFNGAGDTWTPTYLNILCFWLWEIPLAWVLAHMLGWGPHGVAWSITIAFSTLAVVAAVVFRRGTWKDTQV